MLSSFPGKIPLFHDRNLKPEQFKPLISPAFTSRLIGEVKKRSLEIISEELFSLHLNSEG